MDKDNLRSYFGEYSPSAKAFQTMGGQDEFFHEVAKFMLEVGFVTPHFYGEPHVNPNDMTRIQEGQSSVTSVREATAFPEIPPATHELVAILQFGTSYELVEWLARRLQEVSDRMAQEHQDQIMIQKTLRGVVEPQDQQEIDRIGRQRNAKNKGEAIQMPPLHEALVEVHNRQGKPSSQRHG